MLYQKNTVFSSLHFFFLICKSWKNMINKELRDTKIPAEYLNKKSDDL